MKQDTNTNWHITVCDWSTSDQALMYVRRIVFIDEQCVPEELEWDEFDAISWHLLVADTGGNPIATGRLQPDGKITRIAVVPEWRRRGVADAMLTHLKQLATENGISRLFMHAQTSAIELYLRHGFSTAGSEFDEAGIPHIEMTYEAPQ